MNKREIQKILPKPPFFETSVKNYIFGDDVYNYALAVDAAAKKYDVDAIFIAPYTEIRRIAENTDRIFVFAPYMDTLKPGRGIADVLPEAIKSAGAKGVMLNHCERPMTLPQIKRTIDRANELGLITFACADSISETKAIAQFQPDIINPEPSELIGTDQASNMDYVVETLKVVKEIFPNILVEQAAGITTGRQIYDFIMAGNDAAGSASGILNSPDPYKLLDEMVYNVRKAKDELEKSKGHKK
ncbi:triose-phosphate isomerase [Oceanispirochaeta crateris]|uniref:Triose-phosphate isomerase n=1 Tax=Oceanispirochaeta crateris TaxID=2518645 RepID=A0A5C1QM71_9SPIO|nr:triose-phosphate isomerase [Oceanispirochaeta crateris]QEN09163.1 triose-phosphate isomerase [Oceanispirochaeta crateris]